MSKIEKMTIVKIDPENIDAEAGRMAGEGWVKARPCYFDVGMYHQDMERLSRERPSLLAWAVTALLGAWFAVASVIAVAVILGVVV